MSLSKKLHKNTVEKQLNKSDVVNLLNLIMNGNEIISFFKESNSVCDFIKNNKKKIVFKDNHSVVHRGYVIGRGYGGIVYDIDFKVKGIPVVIKKVNVNSKNLCSEDNEFVKSCSKYIAETMIGTILSTLYTKGLSPNFVRIFHSFLCPKTRSGYQIIERIDGTLEELDKLIKKHGLEKKTKMSIPDLKTNAIFQICHALMTQQEKFGITHLDLKPDNVFIKILTSKDIYNGKVLKKQKFLHYTIGKKKKKIANPGFLVKIGDFGESRAFKIKTALSDNLQIKRQLVDEKIKHKISKILSKNEFFKRDLIRMQFKADSLFRPTLDLQFLMNNLLFDPEFSGLTIINEYFLLVEEKLCKDKNMCNIDRNKLFIPNTGFKRFPTSRFPTTPATITPKNFLLKSIVFQNI